MAAKKILAGVGALVVIGGSVGLFLQRQLITELRDSEVRLQRQVAELAAVNATNFKARGEAEKELAKLRLQSVPAKVTDGDERRVATANEVAAAAAGGVTPKRLTADRAAREEKKLQLHRRYDPFYRQRGLTEAQAERMIELKMQQAEAREDLQAAVETAGLRGDTKGIEAMRSKLYEPITKEVREILGEVGYAAYGDYEATSFYREAFVEPMSDLFAVAHAALTPEQTEQLVRALDANKQLRRVDPSKIGSEVEMNWDGVINQIGASLTPAQVNVIRVYAERQKANGR